MFRAYSSAARAARATTAGRTQRYGDASIKCLIGPTPMSKDDRRQALVQAAFNQIAERGFEGLRTREVAAEVGVNIATLHYYFPTKEALVRAMERFRTTLSPHGSAAEQLRSHLRSVRGLLTREPKLGAVMAELALRSA